jgi:hypothetical protein
VSPLQSKSIANEAIVAWGKARAEGEAGVRVVSSPAPRGGGEGRRRGRAGRMDALDGKGREPGGQHPVATNVRFGGNRNGTEEGMADRNSLEAVGFAGGQSVSPGCCARPRPPVARDGDASCPGRTGPKAASRLSRLAVLQALPMGHGRLGSRALRDGGPGLAARRPFLASGSRWFGGSRRCLPVLAPFCFTDSPFEQGRRPGAGTAARC